MVLVAVQLFVLGLYLPPVLKVAREPAPPQTIISLPVHTAVCMLSRSRARWWCWWLSNCLCWDCISRQCSNRWCRCIRPRRSFRCQSRLPCDTSRAAGALVVLVAVQLSVLGLYLPPVLKKVRRYQSAPDDHFAAGPHRRVSLSGSGRVGCAGGCPTVSAGIVSPASIKDGAVAVSAPDDHFAASPDCRVSEIGRRAR